MKKGACFTFYPQQGQAAARGWQDGLVGAGAWCRVLEDVLQRRRAACPIPSRARYHGRRQPEVADRNGAGK